ncbi:hypothetical protein WOLCODRAFT_16579 [Wolfiporia cocos MD-104 SS10]|uniref:Uncharacterized protein n=1 Tax=Wolfiporia cocos (strain MD-104) TaxID=742152 RepID=A0A2H3JWJ8_WOLCO|nr:hypothetical protein WOLCODRAFT_16579 [Wolfiporia cocos MD-104 SS10]
MPSRPQPHSASSPEPIFHDHENEDPLEDYESFKRLKIPTLVPFVKAAKLLPHTISPYSSFEDALERHFLQYHFIGKSNSATSMSFSRSTTLLMNFRSKPEQRMLCEDVLKGRIRINAGDWPTFLYDEDTPYDPDHIDNGLCCVYIIQHTFHCIFTGPHMAKKDMPSPSSGKTSKLKLGGISHVMDEQLHIYVFRTGFMGPI